MCNSKSTQLQLFNHQSKIGTLFLFIPLRFQTLFQLLTFNCLFFLLLLILWLQLSLLHTLNLIFDAFDNIVAPPITSPNSRHRFIKVFLSRTLLSNATYQIHVPLSNHLNQITINCLNILTIHCLMLSGIDI